MHSDDESVSLIFLLSCLNILFSYYDSSVDLYVSVVYRVFLVVYSFRLSECYLLKLVF